MQLMPSSSSKVTIDRVDASLDVNNHSLPVPSSVAVRTEHTPDEAPFASYSGDLGTTLGEPATASAPFGQSFPP